MIPQLCRVRHRPGFERVLRVLSQAFVDVQHPSRTSEDAERCAMGMLMMFGWISLEVVFQEGNEDETDVDE